jgi:PPOX class probable F420-dependent enzyme
VPQPIPETYLDLFQKKSIAYLGTAMADGTPQVTPVWVDYDGQYVLVNTAVGRLKDRNMTARPQVGIAIQDPDDTDRYLAIQGRIVGVLEDGDGAHEHINQLSWRYNHKDFVFPPGQMRRIYKISTEKVLAGY